MQKIFSSPRCPDWLRCPPSLLWKGYWSSFLGVQQPGHESDHSPQTEVKKEHSCTSTPPIMPSWHTQGKLYVLTSINVNAPFYHLYQKTVITENISIQRYVHELLIMYKITKEDKNLRVQTGSVGLSDIKEFHRTTFCRVYDHKQLLTTSFPAICPNVSEPFPPNSFL